MLSLHCEQRFDIRNSFSELLLHEGFIKQFNHEGVLEIQELYKSKKDIRPVNVTYLSVISKKINLHSTLH